MLSSTFFWLEGVQYQLEHSHNIHIVYLESLLQICCLKVKFYENILQCSTVDVGDYK